MSRKSDNFIFFMLKKIILLENYPHFQFFSYLCIPLEFLSKNY